MSGDTEPPAILVGDCVSRPQQRQSAARSLGARQCAHRFSRNGNSPAMGLVVRTHRGVACGYENEDPDGLDPAEGQVQVCWSSGAVENVDERDVYVADRLASVGHVLTRIDYDEAHRSAIRSENSGAVSARSQKPNSHFKTRLPTDISDLWRAAESKTASSPDNVLRFTPVEPFSSTELDGSRPRKREKALVIATEQRLNIRLLWDATAQCSSLTQQKPPRSLHVSLPAEDISTLPKLEHKMDSAYLRNVRTTFNMAASSAVNQLRCADPSDWKQTRSELPVTAIVPLGEGSLVTGFGWAGIVENVKVRYTVQLDGGVFFNLTVNSSQAPPAGAGVLRPDPSQPVMSNEPLYLFPGQRVIITPTCLTSFTSQLREMTDTDEVRTDSAKQAAVETWLNEVSTGRNLGHGRVVACEVMEMHVRWLVSASLGQRTPPNRIIRPSDVAPLTLDLFQLGQPLFVSTNIPVRVADVSSTEATPSLNTEEEPVVAFLSECFKSPLDTVTESSASLKANIDPAEDMLLRPNDSEERQLLGVVHTIETRFSLLWDNGEIERDAPSSAFKSCEITCEPNGQAITYGLKKDPQCSRGLMAQKEELLHRLLVTGIFHPHTIVRRVPEAKRCPYEKHSLLDDACPCCSAESLDTSAVAHLSKPCTLPYPGFQFKTLNPVMPETSMRHPGETDAGAPRRLNIPSLPPDTYANIGGIDVPLLHVTPSISTSTQRFSDTSNGAPHGNQTAPTEQRESQNSGEAKPGSASFGIIIAVDEEHQRALVGWVKDPAAFLTFKKGQRKRNAPLCSSAPLLARLQSTTLTDLGLCICKPNDRLNCQAYCCNTQRFTDATYLEWQHARYTSSKVTDTPYRDFFEFSLEPLSHIAADPAWAVTPGLIGYPAGDLLMEIHRYLQHCYTPENPTSKTSTPTPALPDWGLDAIKELDHRFLFYEILASAGGSVWIKTGDGQVVEALIGELSKLQHERYLFHLRVTEDWSDDEDDLDSSEDSEGYGHLGDLDDEDEYETEEEIEGTAPSDNDDDDDDETNDETTEDNGDDDTEDQEPQNMLYVDAMGTGEPEPLM